MAQNTRVIVTDDLDGSEGARTVSFSIEAGSYEIDLTDANVDKLYQALDPFLSKARKVSGRGNRTAKSSTATKSDLSAVREWASKNGHSVSSRGRVPQRVLDAYNEAH